MSKSRSLLLRELWPDPLPVVGSQVAASYGATSSALDVRAAFYRYRSTPSNPLVHRRIRDADEAGQFGLAPARVGGALHGLVHAAIIRLSLILINRHCRI